MSRKFLKGKGAQYNPKNRFQTNQVEWGDEELYNRKKPKVQVYTERPKSLLNKNNSPDITFTYSMNPYQGCEHGCSYCYARITHEYWGFSAGLDFESRIMVKENAPQLLRKKLTSKNWQVEPIMMSGNTDCYQPLEKQYRLTRQLLAVCLEYGQPVTIITKNALIVRDLDILTELAKKNLVNVILSITTTNESLRRAMEPRTSTLQRKLEVIAEVSSNNIPVAVNLAPIIPALNAHEIPNLVKLSAEAGADSINYASVRLNGATADVFKDWIRLHFPDKTEKVLNGIASLHGGEIGDSQWRRRMRGAGQEAKVISQLFHAARRKYFKYSTLPPLSLEHFSPLKMKSLFDD